MSPLDILRAHLEAQRRRRFEIPSAGPAAPALVLYFDPVTLLELAELEPHRKKGAAELYAQAVVLKALTEDGEKAFTLEDLYLLRRLPASLLLALGEAILDTGPSAAAVGEPSGGRNAQPSAPPSTSPPPPDVPPSTPSPTPPPYGPDGLPPVL